MLPPHSGQTQFIMQEITSEVAFEALDLRNAICHPRDLRAITRIDIPPQAIKRCGFQAGLATNAVELLRCGAFPVPPLDARRTLRSKWTSSLVAITSAIGLREACWLRGGGTRGPISRRSNLTSLVRARES